jgi:hypothetical protein
MNPNPCPNQSLEFNLLSISHVHCSGPASQTKKMSPCSQNLEDGMFLRDDVYGRATGALSSTEVVAARISEWIGGRGYLF